jgi:scyllo-inositol 2-dehydrogenase (NADP+)
MKTELRTEEWNLKLSNYNFFMDDIIKVGLVGYGIGGEYFHAPIINAVPKLKLTDVVERHKQKSKERYPSVKVIKNFDDLLKDQHIRLIVITTPNWFHFEMALKALQAGKHVVVDKPFTVTSKEADTLIELAQQKNLILSVYQNRRFDGDFLTVKKIIENNWVGKVKKFEVCFDRFRPEVKQDSWRENGRQGSGVLYDLAPHLIDQALNLFGLPQTIKADVKTERERAKSDDCFEIELKYPEVTVVLKAGMLVEKATPHFVLTGDMGTYTRFGLDPQEETLKKGGAPGANNWGHEPSGRWGFLDSKAPGLKYYGKIETLPGCYQAYYQNVYNAIKGEEELIVKPEEARNVIRIIELALKSSKEKKAVEYCANGPK